MAFETKVPYRVTQKILKKWLEENIGKEHDAAGKPCWKYVQAHKEGEDWWLVTAPRPIGKDEIEDMKIQDKKQKPPTYTFQENEGDEDD